MPPPKLLLLVGVVVRALCGAWSTTPTGLPLTPVVGHSAAYKQFCDDTTVEKQRAVNEANEMVAVLQADIEKYEADGRL